MGTRSLPVSCCPRRPGARAADPRWRPLSLLLAALLFAGTAAPAQTLMGLDGAGVTVFEFTGPPAGPCGYPTGPVVGAFPYVAPFVCPTAGPIAPPPPVGLLGGLANNAPADSVFVTDGALITEYGPGGAPLASFPAPVGLGPLTALAYDPAAGVLYCTDGTFAVGLFPPPAPGCAPAALAVPPWLLSLGPLVTGLTWHAPSGTLFAVDVAGAALNSPPGGPPVFAWPAVPAAACAVLVGPPQAIAFDRTTPGAVNPSSFYITDGATVVYVNLGGAPAAPTSYTTAACFPVPGPPISGLAFTSHGINYGKGSDPAGLVPPVFVHAGQFTTPSAPVSVGIAGADPTPGTMGALFWNVGPAGLGGGQACPPITGLGGNGILLGFPFFGPLGPIFPITGGSVGFTTALPAGLPLGVEIDMQWFVAKGSGGFQVSDGFTVALGVP